MLTLIIGGASSGKSAVAEDIAMSVRGKCAYVATMQPFGEQGKARAARHLKLREGKGMTTIEQYTDIGKLKNQAAAFDVLLIECMTNLTANEQFAPERQSNESIADKIFSDIEKLMAICGNIVIVSCDLFADGIEYPKETKEYMENLGRLNRLITEKADTVIEVFYGIPRYIKGGKRDA